MTITWPVAAVLIALIVVGLPILVITAVAAVIIFDEWRSR